MTIGGYKLNNLMSNSTQNKCPFCNSELISLVLPSNPPQYKTHCPNCENSKVSNSTQNDHETHTACIERIKKEGASATCCHCNPHDGCTLEMKPTQNDWYDHAVKNPGFKSGLNALKNDTQNDWDGELYKVACHIHAESMAYKVGMAGADYPEMSVYKRLKTLLADARREGGLKHYMRVSEHLRQYGRDRIMKKDERAEGFYEAIEEFERYFGLADVLATLREEEGK